MSLGEQEMLDKEQSAEMAEIQEELVSLRIRVKEVENKYMEVLEREKEWQKEKQEVTEENKRLKNENSGLVGKNIVLKAQKELVDTCLKQENVNVRTLREEVDAWVGCVEKAEASAKEKTRLYEAAREQVEKKWEKSRKDEKVTSVIQGSGCELDEWYNDHFYELGKRKKRSEIPDNPLGDIKAALGRIVGSVEAKMEATKEREEGGVFCVTSEMVIRQIKDQDIVRYEIIECNVQPKRIDDHPGLEKETEDSVDQGKLQETGQCVKEREIELRLAEMRKTEEEV